MTANDNPQPDGKRRSSQKRQRRNSLQIALDHAELAQVEQNARACGLSRSSYGRAAILGTTGPRAQRSPTVNAVVISKATAELNKAGSNLNQIAHALNAGRATSLGRECFLTLSEVRAAAAAIRQSVGRKNRS